MTETEIIYRGNLDKRVFQCPSCNSVYSKFEGNNETYSCCPVCSKCFDIKGNEWENYSARVEALQQNQIKEEIEEFMHIMNGEKQQQQKHHWWQFWKK